MDCDTPTIATPAVAVDCEHRDFWSSQAARSIHWFRDTAWLTQESVSRWTGWHGDDASPTVYYAHWQPWSQAVDDSCSPVVRWFTGGLTNAAFNELDRHVLDCHMDATAFICDADGSHICYRALLVESTLVAVALSTTLGVVASGRLALFLPNNHHAITWIAAAKRAGVVYVAVASGTASRALAERLDDSVAAVLVTCESLLEVASEARRLTKATSPAGVLVPPSTNAPVDGWQDSNLVLRDARMRWRDECPDDAEPSSSTTLVAALWACAPPRPVDACHPLLLLYTSGSTGRPKGIVHTHGGWEVGLCVTSRVVLDVRPSRDALLVVATPGWITGQAYMIAAALLMRVPSVLLEGSPVSPPDRFAATMSRHAISVIKTGSTMLRVLMAAPNAASMLDAHDLSTLRLGCFCAEPLSPQVHAYAHQHLGAPFINAYWATEHGGIIFGRESGRCASAPRADAHSLPLPWIDPLVMVVGGGAADASGRGWRVAIDGEAGDLVLRGLCPPYMALTVWSANGFGAADWCGDAVRWERYFSAEHGRGYVQGDAVVRHADGSYSFPGRSDADYMNVAGHRIGAAEVEGALLLDRQHDDGSCLLDCTVVGLPDELSGTTPYAFVVVRPRPDSNASGEESSALDEADERRLCALVEERLGWAAVPTRFVVVHALPKTHSGKYARALMRAAFSAAADGGASSLGDAGGLLSAIANPECIPSIITAIVADSRSAETLPTLHTGIIDVDAARVLLRAIWRRVLRLAPPAHNEAGVHDTTPFGALGGASLAATQALVLAARHGMPLRCDAASLERMCIAQLVENYGMPVPTPLPPGANGAAAPPTLAVEGNASSEHLTPIRIGAYHKAAAGAAPTRLVILERDGRYPATMHLRDVGFIGACAAGELDRARSLRDGGHYAAHAADKFGSTALMWAASFGRVEVARWLVHEVGVDVDARNKQGRTALMFATKYGQCALADFLLHEAKCDVAVRMRDASSAFDWAVFGGDRPTMELLASHPNVDINGMNRHGCAAVQWAAAAGNLDTCRWLQAKGVDLSHVNDANHGAVEKAAWRGHDALLRWLLLADDGPRLLLQLRVRDAEGRSVADLCRLGGHHETATWLEPLVAAQMEEGVALV